jgi:hypothetical protein
MAEPLHPAAIHDFLGRALTGALGHWSVQDSISSAFFNPLCSAEARLWISRNGFTSSFRRG